MDKSSELTLRLQYMGQLFIEQDSIFIPKRRLNESAEEFLIEETAALSRNTRITLKIYFPANEAGREEEAIAAVREHFAWLREKSQKKLKRTIQFGWRFLLVGFVFLALIYLITELLDPFIEKHGFGKVFRESLIILGWVALWRPADLLLYEWRADKSDADLFRRIEQSNVQVSCRGDGV